MDNPISQDQNLFSEISRLIMEARQRTALAINSELSQLYWTIGKRIQSEILKHDKPVYGEQTIKLLSEQLTIEYGKGWSDKQLRHCLHVVETFPNEEIFSALRRQLTWSHIKVLSYIGDNIKRDF
jgi:hypothetical protein